MNEQRRKGPLIVWQSQLAASWDAGMWNEIAHVGLGSSATDPAPW